MNYDTRIINVEKGVCEGARLIARGEIVAFPTETVYGLGADATNETAVARIFSVKGRPGDNPLIVHICDINQVEILARDISPVAKKLIDAFFPGAFTAVLKASDVIPKSVRGGLDTVAIRMPAHNYALELIKKSGTYIAAPSANASGRPSPTNARDVFADLQGKIPLILDGGDCAVGVESTVCDLTSSPVILRPGGVTREMMERVCGEVSVAKGVLKHAEGRVRSPGMKYRHYSPKAKVYVVAVSDQTPLAKKLNLVYDEFTRSGNRPVIFATGVDASAFEGRNLYALGQTPEQVAGRMFSALRRADDDGYDIVLFEDTSLSGMGLAVMNRILRSAGFSVL